MALGRFGTLAVLNYNGYDLSKNESVETTRFSVRPVYDSARRTVKWCEFEVALRWYVASDNTSPHVKDMVARLSKSGGELTYSGRGTGFDAPINRGTVKDVDFGPRPGAVVITPMGGDNAVKVEWNVSFSIPSCPDGVFTGLAEWCYTVSDSLDAERVTTRTTSGRLVIANNRTAPGSRLTRDNANSYLEDVWPPVGPDFELVDNSHDTSEDRSTLTYTQVIRERGAAPGLNILTQSGGESMVTPPGATLVHTRRIQYRYTIRPDRTAKAAFDHFVPLVRDRLTRAVQIPGVQLLFAGFSADTGDPHKPRQQVSLSLSFSIVGASIAQALGMSGMWQPIPNSNRRLWYATVSDVLGPRGKANLIFDPKADAIVDLCRRNDASPGASQPQPGRDSEADLRNLPDLFPAPTPDNSWLKYDVYLRTVVDPGNIVLKTLPEDPLVTDLKSGIEPPRPGAPPKPTPTPVPGNPPQVGLPGVPTDPFDPSLPGNVGHLGFGGFLGEAAGAVGRGASRLPRVAKSSKGGKPVWGSKKDTHVQQRVSPTVYVNLYGRALRHGYPIECPTITSVDGHPAEFVRRGLPDEGFVTGVVGQNVYPVYGARFSVWYLVRGLDVAVTPGQPVPGR